MANADQLELQRLLTQEYDPQQAVVPYGNAILRMERLDDDVVLGWLSRLSVAEFLERLDPEPGKGRITLSRRLDARADVPDEVLLKPDRITDEQEEAILLVRLDLDDAAVVWERTGEDYSDISVAASSWERAEGIIARFIPPRDFETVPLRVAERLRAAS